MNSENNKVPETHPSFGVVCISRTSGSRRLFDSPFESQHFITLSISRAERSRNQLHDNLIMPTEELVEISMSEIQFAAMITTLNTATGTPCTLSRFDGKIIKEPEADQTKQTFAHEAREHFTDLATMASELEKLTNLPPKDVKAEQRERMRFLALKIHQSLTGNIDFFHERFQESMDKVVSAAKGEIQAHVLNVVQKTGLTAIKGMGLGMMDTSAVNRDGASELGISGQKE